MAGDEARGRGDPAERAADEAGRRWAFVAELANVLSSSLDYAQTLRHAARLVVPGYADFCLISVADGGAIGRGAAAHRDPSREALLAELAQCYRQERARGTPAGALMMDQAQAVFLPEVSAESLRALIAAPGATEYACAARALGMRSLIEVPLVAHGRLLGVLTLAMGESGRSYAARDVALAEEMAQHAALALDNARLYEAEQAARAAAQAAQQRMAFLAETSAALATTLDYERTLEGIARAAVPYLADWCVAYAADEDGTVRPLAIAHVDAAKEGVLADLHRRYALTLDDDTVGRVLRTGQAAFDAVITPQSLAAAVTDAALLEKMLVLGPTSHITVPLVARGRTLGAVSFLAGVEESGRHFGPSEVALAEELARRAALALDNARLYAEARQAIKLRDEFLSIASHELKTPLTSLAGYTQLLLRRTARRATFGEREQAALDIVAKQAARLNRLIEALLDISRLQQGHLSIERAPLDLAALAHRVVEEIRPTLDQHTLTFRAAGSAVVVEGDELRLEQVVHNLVGNAVKYSPEGSTVDVRVEGDGRQACLSVSDQGIGIPPAALPHVFTRYYRAPNVSPRTIGGLGVGLYVVREIVGLHGGSVVASSDEGAGSTFVVRLPLAAGGPPR